MKYEKPIPCNHCETIKRLDEIIKFDSDNVKCIDCEVDSLKAKYEAYDFFINPVEENKNITSKRTGVKKVMAWCLG